MEKQRKLKEVLSSVHFKESWPCEEFCSNEQKDFIAEYLRKIKEFGGKRVDLEKWLENRDGNGDCGEVVSICFFFFFYLVGLVVFLRLVNDSLCLKM